MSVNAIPLVEHEPPSTPIQRVAEKTSRFLLYFLCAAPIALFPIGLIYKTIAHFFPSWLP